ncbi:BadM/Rrf2 family transcriptional regulator [Paraburkholderia sp. BL18I3N2]|nr:BadM/Rrf2 family transcriptional regulator [Paraburkholderia sp. BL18I3N2]
MSRTLHALIHMERADGPLTSEALAEMLATNAVVVRRMFGGLRDAGYVQSEKGHGGGWVLATPLEEITLLDVYRAVGEPPLFSHLVSEDRPECLIERAVNAHLSATLRDAQSALLAKFEKVTLAMLSSGFKEASTGKGKSPQR